MGEFAGYALDEAMDAENDRWLYRQGEMSEAEAYERGIVDHYGRYSHVPMLPRQTAKSCRHCGMGGLSWRQATGGWRLHCGAVMHVCNSYSQKERA